MLNDILSRGYLKKGEKSWEDIALRVSKFAGGKEMFRLMCDKKLIPASPFLINAGTDHPQCFSCFVLPLEDNLKSIFQFYTEAATIFKSSGGVGANWSKLRPVGSPLSGGGTTSGVISFMEIFDQVIEKVKQGGMKKGAALACLDITHPEVEDFIRSKLIKGSLTNMNISPIVRDDFMRRVTKKDPEALRLFNLIVDCTWKCSEPGMLFIDTANRDNTVPGLGDYESTNPCGELWLLDYECCCLCGINLVPFCNGMKVDFGGLEKAVRTAIRFMDEAIDKNEYPIPQIEEMSKRTRRIGLYPLGVADVLVNAKLPYNSKDGRAFIESIWEFVNKIAWDESVKLGQKLGQFPAHEHRDTNLVPEGARNASVTCAAPGGTTSFIAGSNYGIEPFTSFVSIRRNGAGEGMIIEPHFEEMLDTICPEHKQEAIDHCLKTGSIHDLDFIPSEIRKVFVTAYGISWKDHIDMQVIFQKLCHGGSISKTVNLPESTTREDIAEAYIYAWKKGCKGITFYREGTRDAVYNLQKEKIKRTGPDYKVPKTAPAIRYNVNVGCGRMSVIVVGDPETYEPIEVWMIPVSGGGCAGHCSGEGRTISNALQYGFPPERFASSMGKVVCKACANKEKLDGKSCPDAAGRKLIQFIKDSPVMFNQVKEDLEDVIQGKKEGVCPDCGAELEHAQGCVACRSCGWSGCS